MKNECAKFAFEGEWCMLGATRFIEGYGDLHKDGSVIKDYTGTTGAKGCTTGRSILTQIQ